MKRLEDLLLLGNPLLYEKSEPVLKSELVLIPGWIADLHEVMQDIRLNYNFGRAIAAPQIGLMKRVIYLNINRPVIIINPELIPAGDDMVELWDDCMCFPNLLVKVKRYKRIVLRYNDEHWERQEWKTEDDMSELLQHEYDHLEGILCTMRAVDEKSFRWRNFKIITDSES